MEMSSNKTTRLTEPWPKRRVGCNRLQTYIQTRTSPKELPVISVRIYVTRSFLSIATLHFSYVAKLLHFLLRPMYLIDTVKTYNSFTRPDPTQSSLGIINLHP